MMRAMTEFKTFDLSEENISLAAKLNQMAMERIVQAKAAGKNTKKEDPAEAIVKAFADMDRTMMKVMDEHIERVRKSSERNKELYRKLAIKKEIEKRAQKREEYFEQAAEKAEERRKFLQMSG